MKQKKALAQYCEDNILEIPSGLYNMRDIKPLLYNAESSIFYKDLERDLVNIEFHTKVPCIVYNEYGTEVITTCHNESFKLGSGEIIYLPKGLNLYSDYIHEGDRLSAYLLFFGPEVLSRFLATGTSAQSQISNEQAIFKREASPVVKAYFDALLSMHESLNNSPHLLKLKLLELLHLLDIDDDGSLRKSLSAAQCGSPKRNIKRLMDQYALSGYCAKELAVLSGRSVSTFSREFKSLYGTTPKQWLIERRMAYAHTLLSSKKWPVTTVAIEVGYSNISHFIEAFKKKYGKTPYQIKAEK